MIVKEQNPHQQYGLDLAQVTESFPAPFSGVGPINTNLFEKNSPILSRNQDVLPTIGNARRASNEMCMIETAIYRGMAPGF